MKKLKIILISILCCSALLFGGGLSLFQVYNQPEVTAASGYDFDNGEISSKDDSNYTSNSSFTISSLEGFKNFASSVTTFQGKTVMLTEDIDCNLETIKIEHFKGVFDGGGHTISNVEVSYTWYDDDATYPLALAYGLFGQLTEGGVIKRLRLYQIFSSAISSNYSNVLSSLVAFCDSGTIQECVIQNVHFRADISEDISCNIAGIVGAGNDFNIVDCVVDGVMVDKYTRFTYFSQFGPAKHYIFSHEPQQGTLKNLIFKDDTSSISGCIIEDYLFSGPDFWDNLTLTGCYLTNDSTYSDISNKSAEGGKENDSCWYYYSGLKYPVLRIFETWKEIELKINDSSLGSISKNMFYILEKDFSVANQWSTYISVGVVTVFEQKVTATPNDDSEFVEWKCDTEIYTSTNEFGLSVMELVSVSYTAYFKPIITTYFISFANSDQNVSVISSTITIGENYELLEDTEINISYSTYKKTATYKEITFSFVDLNSNEKSITYQISNTKYYIDKISNLEISMGVTSFKISSNLSDISVTTHVKSYGAVFN